MAVLGGRQVQKIRLPSSTDDDPAWVEIDLNFSAGTILDAQASESLQQASVIALSQMITAWNFTDEAGAVAPITPDTLRKLGFQDFTYLDSYLQKRMNLRAAAVSLEEKKASV